MNKYNSCNGTIFKSPVLLALCQTLKLHKYLHCSYVRNVSALLDNHFIFTYYYYCYFSNKLRCCFLIASLLFWKLSKNWELKEAQGEFLSSLFLFTILFHLSQLYSFPLHSIFFLSWPYSFRIPKNLESPYVNRIAFAYVAVDY